MQSENYILIMICCAFIYSYTGIYIYDDDTATAFVAISHTSSEAAAVLLSSTFSPCISYLFVRFIVSSLNRIFYFSEI